ncbi:peptidoglycan glycosyltransferase FtsW [Propionibacterium freudenreichii]|uniref:peptidoglycan glycosyltransferase FtsW n=1 Tax=Propionibacterium freudenreichii TaxID=1744 RepID=UPI0038545618
MSTATDERATRDPDTSGGGASSLSRAFAHPLADYYLLLTCSGLLLALGVIMVLSSSSAYAAANMNDSYYFFTRQVAFLIAGVLACGWLARRSEDFFKLFGWVVLIGSMFAQFLVLLTPLGTPPSGISSKGNRNWLYLGPLSMQPAEFAKLGLIVWAAAILATRGTTIREPKRLFVPYLVGFGVVLGMVLAGGDLGTAVIIVAIMIAMLWFVGAPGWTLAGIIGVAGLGALGMVVTSANRMARVKAFLSGSGASSEQPLHSIYALATGGWWGVGLGRSRMKWGGLYDGVLNDYVFAVLGEEMGLIGTLTLIVLFLVFGIAGVRIALRSKGTFWRLAAAGITAWFLVQACANIAVAMKLLPVMGVPLPFISYGGSSLLANLMGVGVLLAAARNEPDAKVALNTQRPPAAEPARVTSVVDRKGR